MSGAFITFEGIEGSGKTTQIKLLASHLKAKGLDVVLTREPGGTAIGDKIRAVLLNSVHSGMSPVAELLLYNAARNQHIAEVIAPALERGRTVICDRYADATTAYQGAARKIPPQTIEAVHKIATGGLMPDLTILLDVPVRVGLGRTLLRNKKDSISAREDRFEREREDFHDRVREGYLDIARKEPERVKVVGADAGMDEVQKEIIKLIEAVIC